MSTKKDGKTMSIFQFEEGSTSTIIGINQCTKNIIFPSYVERIVDFSESTSLINQCNGEQIESIDFEDDSEITYIGNYSFSYSNYLRKANLSQCLHLTSLSACLFRLSSNLTTIILPENGQLRTLCSGCLAHTSIQYIKIPDTVEVMENYVYPYQGVFRSCNELSIIEISPSSNLTYIGYSIAQNSIVTSFYVPPKVNKIVDGAFNFMTCLSNLTVDSNNENYCSIDNIMYSFDLTKLHTCAPNKLTPISIPTNVTYIYSESFRSCQQKVQLKLPEVEVLYFNTFASTLFTEFILPSNLKTIYGHCFDGTIIKSITLPRTLSSIQSFAFYKSQIENLSFTSYEQNVSIYDSAFAECSSLRSVYLPRKGVTFLYENVFSNCSNLMAIYYITEPLPNHKKFFPPKAHFNAQISIQKNDEQEEDENKYNICGYAKYIHIGSNNECFIHHFTCKHNQHFNSHFLVFAIFIPFIHK